jgi:hypothetical protein
MADAGTVLAPPKPAGPTPLEGETTPTFYNLRDAPGGKVVGALPGKPVLVTVVDKRTAADGVWFEILLREPIGALQPGSRAWVTASSVIATADWQLLLDQLRQFEAAHSSLKLGERITKLRQWSHVSNLPFDRVIGTARGTEYLETRPPVTGAWQLLTDYQSMRAPDGSVVDLQHLLVGIDVLAHRVEDQTFGQPGSYGAYRLGPNYSAATWAGDIGAAAADMTLRVDADWEKNTKPSVADRFQHYFDTRVSQADLLGDIDAWGIAELREQQATRLDTIEKLLTTYYGDLTPSGTPGRKLTNRRQNAIENFLRAYGFEFDYAKHQYPRTLTGQKASFEHMKEQIRLFTRVWIVYRKKVMDREIVVDPGVLDGMTTYFLRWLERQAIENGAVTK